MFYILPDTRSAEEQAAHATRKRQYALLDSAPTVAQLVAEFGETGTPNYMHLWPAQWRKDLAKNRTSLAYWPWVAHELAEAKARREEFSYHD